jgi:hypothetical protein
MADSITTRPNLDEHDFATVRQLYSEAQQWARHYESLIINANVLIVSASLIFVGLAFGDKIGTKQSLLILSVPVAMAFVGIMLTHTLFVLYTHCIERLIRFENLLNCFDETKFSMIDNKGSLLPLRMMELPVHRPPSVVFFLWLYSLLILTYLLLMALKGW